MKKILKSLILLNAFSCIAFATDGNNEGGTEGTIVNEITVTEERISSNVDFQDKKILALKADSNTLAIDNCIASFNNGLEVQGGEVIVSGENGAMNVTGLIQTGGKITGNSGSTMAINGMTMSNGIFDVSGITNLYQKISGESNLVKPNSIININKEGLLSIGTLNVNKSNDAVTVALPKDSDTIISTAISSKLPNIYNNGSMYMFAGSIDNTADMNIQNNSNFYINNIENLGKLTITQNESGITNITNIDASTTQNITDGENTKTINPQINEALTTKLGASSISGGVLCINGKLYKSLSSPADSNGKGLFSEVSFKDVKLTVSDTTEVITDNTLDDVKFTVIAKNNDGCYEILKKESLEKEKERICQIYENLAKLFLSSQDEEDSKALKAAESATTYNQSIATLFKRLKKKGLSWDTTTLGDPDKFYNESKLFINADTIKNSEESINFDTLIENEDISTDTSDSNSYITDVSKNSYYKMPGLEVNAPLIGSLPIGFVGDDKNQSVNIGSDLSKFTGNIYLGDKITSLIINKDLSNYTGQICGGTTLTSIKIEGWKVDGNNEANTIDLDKFISVGPGQSVNIFFGKSGFNKDSTFILPHLGEDSAQSIIVNEEYTGDQISVTIKGPSKNKVINLVESNIKDENGKSKYGYITHPKTNIIFDSDTKVVYKSSSSKA